jgi:3-deoxy-D-manno-octulosonate 8-phosphate phosphatase (KDO 8-P phosphatase)
LAIHATTGDIRGLCLDVDGVLTDGRLFVDDTGRGARVFYVHDGIALEWFRRAGGIVVICSGKTSPALAARARELEIEHVIQGSRDKVADVQNLAARLGLTLAQFAAIGDDLPDVPLMRRCGCAIAVANAVDEVKAVAHLVTQRRGGRGAVREAVEHLLRSSGRWDEILAQFGIAASDPRA